MLPRSELKDQSGVDYKIHCNNCNDTYIGLAKRAIGESHSVDFEVIKILASRKDFFKNKFFPDVNQNQLLDLSSFYDATHLQKISAQDVKHYSPVVLTLPAKESEVDDGMR